MTLDKLLDATRAQGEELREVRETARPKCVAAVRALEAALVAALDGDKLRGMPVLHDGDGRKNLYFGARARGKRIEGALDAKPILIVTSEGVLALASLEVVTKLGDVAVVARPVQDDELLLEDVEDVARAVEEVLRRHLAVGSQKISRYARLRDLADRLQRAMV